MKQGDLVLYNLHTVANGDYPIKATYLGKSKSGKRLIISYRHWQSKELVHRSVRPYKVTPYSQN